MAKLTIDKLMSLEAYAKERNTQRAEVMAHKKDRNVMLGEHVRLIFEDELTIRYQVQEMLRIEKIFEEAGIQEELYTYNPLIPDGCNWKATMMIEYEDIDERRRMLAQLVGIEDLVWVQTKGCDRVFAIADEDLERDTAEKTSAVHFLRFELSRDISQELKQGAELSMGVDHPSYQITLNAVTPSVRLALLGDLQS